MKNTIKILLVAVVMMTTNNLFGQKPIWNVDFLTEFDNREYGGENPIARSQTIFGSRLTPQLGVEWGKNKLVAGTNVIFEFGADPFEVNPDLLLYYNYDSEKYKAYVGAFPRTKMLGQFSTAFFNDSIRFFDNNLEGFMLQYTGKRGFFELGLDWNSRQASEVREKFMIYSAGQINRGLFYAGYALTVYHHAGSAEVDGVVDNILVQPYVGVNLSHKTFLDSLNIQGGYLQAMQNDRRYEGKYVRPGGAVIDITVEKYGFGIYNSLYLGKGIMPYYMYYGTGLYSGDPFYRTDKYNRLEVYWQQFRKGDINLKVSSVHHYDGEKWNWQQLLTFNVNINRRTFSKKVTVE